MSKSDNTIKLSFTSKKTSNKLHTLEVDAILFAIGRTPNVEGMGLETAGIEYSPSDGIYSDKFLRTTNESVYAVGDCIAMEQSPQLAQKNQSFGAGYQFTHNSDVHARSVVRNALFFGSIDRTQTLLPWTTYTYPEIAHVG